MNVARLIPLLAALALVACQSSNAPPAAPTQPAISATDAQAAKELVMYQDLVRSQSYELAAPIGQEIATKFPNTPAATEVQKTLADTMAKATEIGEKRRLSRLWDYQAGTESGGAQVSPAMYSREVAGEDHVRLVLRRHAQWGQSVYLFGSGAGFECGRDCTITARFDDQPPQKLKAYLPKTGEPAIFIDDDRAFIARLDKTRKIELDVVPKGKPKRTIVYEVGGYDASKFPQLPHK